MANRKMEASANQKSTPRNRKKGKRRQLQRNPPLFDPATVLQESQGLGEMLRQRGCLPVDRLEDEQRRQNALNILENILCEWAASIQAKSNDSKWRQPRVSLITFGSYRLGVHRTESDLDVLAMSPPACSRGDFFTSLVGVLRNDHRINDVHAIPSAYTVRDFVTLFACSEFLRRDRFADISHSLPHRHVSPHSACHQVSSQ
jgi:hypothetical protein